MIELDCNQKIYDFARSKTNPKGYLEFYGGKIRYDRFFDLIDNLSRNLSDYGIKQGEVVTLMLPNCPQFAMLVYALSNIGAIASMISPLISEQQTLNILKKTDSKRLFVSSLTKYAFDGVEKIRIDFGHFAGLPAKLLFKSQHPQKSGVPFEKVFLKKNCKKFALPEVNPEDTAFYLNSGGTTGEPKTVKLSQLALNTSAFYIVNNLDENGYTLPVEANAVYILPMFYGYGLSVFHTQTVSSFNQYIRAKFRPLDLVKDIRKNKVEVMFGVPIMFKKMFATGKADAKFTPTLKVCYSGGEKLPKSLQNDFAQNLPEAVILEGYGLSEAVAAFVSQSKLYHKDGSCGRIFGPIKIRAFDGENPLQPNTDGEICVCTRSMMNGYLNDEVNTEKVIFEFEGEKWLRTGDFGKVDSDGYVFLTARIKNIIKRNGIGIFPSQIEACISELSFVKDVVAFGCKDKQDVERIAVAVILKNPDEQDVEQKIKKYVKEKLSVLSMPEFLLVKDRFKLTAVGKVNTMILCEEVKNKFGI